MPSPDPLLGPISPLPRWWRRLVLLVGLVCAAGLTWFVYSFISHMKGIPYAYAKWDTANLLIEYMETHDGKWPRGWQDLQECYIRLTADGRSFDDRSMRSGQSLAELQAHVGIDWNADPTQLLTATPDRDEPFRVVWALNGSTTVWSGAEPNEMILCYLRETATTRPTRGPGTTKPDGR